MEEKIPIDDHQEHDSKLRMHLLTGKTEKRHTQSQWKEDEQSGKQDIEDPPRKKKKRKDTKK